MPRTTRFSCRPPARLQLYRAPHTRQDDRKAAERSGLVTADWDSMWYPVVAVYGNTIRPRSSLPPAVSSAA